MNTTKFAVAGATGRVGRHVVDVLTERGHEVVPMARATGVDVITGQGLAEALGGVDVIIDTASWPYNDQQAATEFFRTSTRNLHEAGQAAGVGQLVVVSIIGIDKFTAGFLASKPVHEAASLAGPLPARILRAAQFNEFVAQILDWQEGDVAYVPSWPSQLVAARTVAEAVCELATENRPVRATGDGPIWEIAGPREESLVEAARRLAARRGEPARVEAVDPPDPLFETGGSLPGPDAVLAGPTFDEWLDEAYVGVRPGG